MMSIKSWFVVTPCFWFLLAGLRFFLWQFPHFQTPHFIFWKEEVGTYKFITIYNSVDVHLWILNWLGTIVSLVSVQSEVKILGEVELVIYVCGNGALYTGQLRLITQNNMNE